MTISKFCSTFIFICAISLSWSQCVGFPDYPAEADCINFDPLMNNTNVNTGDTLGVCGSYVTTDNYSGINMGGGVIRICGNVSMNVNFNSGTIVVQCGSTLFLPNGISMNSNCMIVNYGNVEITGDLNFQNNNNCFYNIGSNSRLTVSDDIQMPQNNGQNAYLINQGFIGINDNLDALEGGFICCSAGSVISCDDFRYMNNCSGLNNRFTFSDASGTATIYYGDDAEIKADLTADSNFDILQGITSNVNFYGCGSWGSANVIPNSAMPADPGQSSVGCGIFCNSGLSVSLNNFDVEKVDGGALLEWSTLSEHNNSYFELYSSRDGVNFQLFDSIPGSGTTTESVTYFAQHYPQAGITYYRLTQVDFDQKRTDLGVRSFHQEENNLLYPNPSNGYVFLNLSNPKDQALSYSILSMQGTILTENKGLSSENNYVFELDISHLPSGLYILVIEGLEERMMYKVELKK